MPGARESVLVQAAPGIGRDEVTRLLAAALDAVLRFPCRVLVQAAPGICADEVTRLLAAARTPSWASVPGPRESVLLQVGPWDRPWRSARTR